MRLSVKQLIWRGNSRERIRTFSEITKDIAGRELVRVQHGELPTDWRPMPDIGSGVIEVRIHRPNEYRIFYIANYPEAIYVLHAFQKTTQRTSERDKQMGKTQYAELQNDRKKEIR
jgi:phage-related protein